MNVTTTFACPNNTRGVFERYGGDLAFYNKFTMKLRVEQFSVPILVILGLPGTIISLIIWTRKHMRYSSSVYLSFLAVGDFMFLIWHIMWHLNSTYSIPVINNRVMCNLFPTVNLLLQYLSPILTLAFTVERYISICWPFFREKLCSIGRAIKVSVTLVFTSFLIASPMLYFFQYVSENNKGCVAIYEMYNQSIPQNESGHWMAMFTYNIISEVTMFGLIPFIILIINVRVIVEMWRIYKSSNCGSSSGDNSHKGATTFTLLTVSFYLIAACLPLTISHLYGFINTNGDLCMSDTDIATDWTWNRIFLLVDVQVFVEFFSLTYYGAKFYLYMATSDGFRAAFCQLFRALRKDSPISRNSRSERKLKREIFKTSDKEKLNLIIVK